MKDGFVLFHVYYFLPPFKITNNGKQIFFNKIPIVVPITMVRIVTPKYSKRQKNPFFIGKRLIHNLCKT